MKKEIIFIGLGRMGSALSARLVELEYVVHGYDPDAGALELAKNTGVITHESIDALFEATQKTSRTIWIMVPSSFVEIVLGSLEPLLQKGDTLIDGGNSFFKDSMRRQSHFDEQGIHFLDCGTSGGVNGARTGASLMVGGEVEAVKGQHDLFTELAISNGYAHVGGPGAGHFTKMVHNGIEYGMMGAIAEGINVLNEHKDGLQIDIHQALKPYEHGSIIEGNLMSWLSESFHTEGYLEHIAGKVPLGETEMEMEYLIQHENVRILEAALDQRKRTRKEPSFIGILISAMRNKFGGHAILEKNKK